MPSKSPQQARFMAAAAHDPGFAAKAGIDQGTAKEFNKADKGKPIFAGKKNKKGKKKKGAPFPKRP